MRILYIHQYFKTPNEPGGTRSYWISKALIEAGHEVIMITQNKKGKEAVELVVKDGINVIQLKNWYANEMSIPSRIKSYFSFMVKSTRQAMKLKNIDMVISTSTPLSVGLPALLLKWFYGIPYLFEVRDLWPEVPIQMGAMKNPVVRWFARFFEKTIYKNSKHIVALSPGMYDSIIKYVSSDKVSMIPNMAKNDKFWPRVHNEKLLTQLGLRKNSFKVIHFGAMGLANGLLYVMEAARSLSSEMIDDVDFVFLGEGKAKKICEDFAGKHKLKNVYFYDRVPMTETSEIVNFCDVSIVPFMNLPILGTNSPNKLFDSLSAAKPVVVNSNGWTKDIVEKYQCGAFVDPNSPIDFAKLIIKWKNDPELIRQMGENGRELARNVYDKSILTKQFVSVVENNFIKQ
ncbi:MAG: glycosyltransferase family 4 protein [Lentimicrobium sp.]|nr:glycosyltransferase family 4 protein [Lentimicrobium sp.]